MKIKSKHHGIVARDARKAWMFLLPWIFGMGAFYLYPFLSSLITSFTDATLTNGNWIGSPDTALPVLILLAVWQFGSSMVIFIAGLQNIPADLYEAAEVDGAGQVKKFFKITLPLLSPTIQFNLIQQLVGAFQVFTQGYIITEGGPMDSTMFSVLYIFDQGLNRMRMGYASAMSWILFLVISAVSILVFWSSKYWVFYQNEEK